MFEPSEDAESAALRWAEQYFPIDQREVAQAVAFSIAETLCVPISHFTPDTDLVSDLGADEAWEWKTMALHLGERLVAEVVLDPEIVGRKPSEIIAFLIANPPLHKAAKPGCWKGRGRRKTA